MELEQQPGKYRCQRHSKWAIKGTWGARWYAEFAQLCLSSENLKPPQLPSGGTDSNDGDDQEEDDDGGGGNDDDHLNC